MKIALENDRVIPVRDKIFELNNRAKAMIEEQGKENVINGTIGALLDDDGSLAVMKSVTDEIYKLEPEVFAEYAPIGGTANFKEAIAKAAFGSSDMGKLKHSVVATPGGTGAIKNAVSNYTKLGDRVLTSDWYWAPYNSICQEQGRKLETYELFDENGSFNFESFEDSLLDIATNQENLLILLNTPAHNPTGYELDTNQWNKLIEIINSEKLEKNKVALFIDVAYIDFAGEPKKVREFLPLLNNLNENILSIIGYSASKTFTLYGMRTGAMICLHKDEEVVEEFRRVCEFSSRNTWSNCNRSGQELIARLYADNHILKKVEAERKAFRDMLLRRGKVFEEYAKEKGLSVVPFVSGFFICMEHDDPAELSEKLAEKGIFVVPLAKGIRISIASISEEQCKKVVDALLELL